MALWNEAGVVWWNASHGNYWPLRMHFCCMCFILSLQREAFVWVMARHIEKLADQYHFRLKSAHQSRAWLLLYQNIEKYYCLILFQELEKIALTSDIVIQYTYYIHNWLLFAHSSFLFYWYQIPVESFPQKIALGLTWWQSGLCA